MFGREVSGLTAAEVDACDMSLSIPIGRLQGEQANADGWLIMLRRHCCASLITCHKGIQSCRACSAFTPVLPQSR